MGKLGLRVAAVIAKAAAGKRKSAIGRDERELQI